MTDYQFDREKVSAENHKKRQVEQIKSLMKQNDELMVVFGAAKKFIEIWQDIGGTQAGLEAAGDELEAAVKKADGA